jgi:hypothetical protein
MNDLHNLHNLIARLKYDIQAKLNITPTWLILDNITYQHLKSTIGDNICTHNYNQGNPIEADKYFGLTIAITTGTKLTLEVR